MILGATGGSNELALGLYTSVSSHAAEKRPTLHSSECLILFDSHGTSGVHDVATGFGALQKRCFGPKTHVEEHECDQK